jgi:hypothetical protein
MNTYNPLFQELLAQQHSNTSQKTGIFKDTVHTIKAHWEAEVQHHPPSTSAKDGQISGPASNPCHFDPKGSASQYPLNRKLVGPQHQFGCLEKEKSLAPPRTEP